MRIILNADDFGFSDESLRATIECFENGSLTSATIMANMPATDAALAFARSHPQFSFGVHLTFTSDGVEHPVCDLAEIPDLVGENGQFLPPLTLRGRAMRGSLPADQVEREMAAQIGKLRDAGVPISHVDSHGHVHKFRSIRQAMHRVLPHFGIRRVRRVQSLFLKKPLRSPAYWLSPLWRRSVITNGGALLTTDHFYMPTTVMDANWPRRFVEQFKGLHGSVEVGVHPGFAAEPWRDAERRECIAFGRLARDAGCELITWNDLAD